MYVEQQARVNFKFEEARFFLRKAGEVLVPARFRSPRPHPNYDTGVICWQPDFYFYLDAFIVSTHSIADLLNAFFGWDRFWDHNPPPFDDTEVTNRKSFQKRFCRKYASFMKKPLSQVRHCVVHRTGAASVEAIAFTVCGQSFVGSPYAPIPSIAARELLPGSPVEVAASAWRPQPVEPSREDFKIEIRNGTATKSLPLFKECNEYLKAAVALIDKARELSLSIHCGVPLTLLP